MKYLKFSTGSMQLILCFFIITMITGCKDQPGHSSLSIGKEGNVNKIIIADNADEVIQFAAAELHDYLQKITNADLKIIREREKNANEIAISLMVDADNPIKFDGYSIDISASGIKINGQQSRSVLYAVYTLLQDIGCSFVYPGKKEEIIPKIETLKLLTQSRIYNPVLELRGLAPYGLDSSAVDAGRDFIDWMAKNRFNYILVSENRPSDSNGPANASIWKEVTDELLPELQKRGFIIEMSEHCTPVFFPRTLFKDHPEWFALNNGERKLGELPYSGQICYSNKGAIEYYGKEIADYALKHPEFHVIGTWPLDGGSYCECENCKDPDTYFKAVVRVAEMVKAVRPDMLVEYLAYQGQYGAPETKKIPSNMSVLWCPDPGQKMDTLQQWIEKAKDAGGVMEFEYFMGDNYRARCNVWLRPDFAASIPEQAKTSGFRGVISLFLPIQNWWRAAFNNSFFAKACWQEDLDVDSTIKAYCNSYYAGQAAEVYEVFQLIFHEFQKEPYRVPEPSKIRGADSIQKVAKKIIAKLDRMLSSTQDEQTRIRLYRIKSYVEFSELLQLAFSTGKKKDFTKALAYSAAHPGQDMVIMYPGYIDWRDSEYFIK